MSLMKAGKDVSAVIASFVGTPEAAGLVVAGFYSAYPHRQPEGTTSDPWTTELAAPNGSATDVAVEILASDEFFQSSRKGGI